MKLIIAIMNIEDKNEVQDLMLKEGYKVTSMSSTGLFLMRNNVTFLIGVEEDQVERALEIIRENGQRRTQVVSPLPVDDNVPADASAAALLFPMEAVVGGATVFVLDVDRFEKY